MEKVPEFTHHHYFHDLESIFYVLCWTCTLHSGPRSTKRQFSNSTLLFPDTSIAKWNGDPGNDTAFDRLASFKRDTVMGRGLEITIRQFAPYFDDIKSFATRFGKLIFSHIWLDSLELEELKEKRKDLDERFEAALPDEKERMKGEYDTLPIHMRPSSVVLDALMAVVDRTVSSMKEEEIIPSIEEVDERNGPDNIEPTRRRRNHG